MCACFHTFYNDPTIWMSDSRGTIAIRDFEKGWVRFLPAHPVGQSKGDKGRQADIAGEEDESSTYSRA